jgi:hypothetical protein
MINIKYNAVPNLLFEKLSKEVLSANFPWYFIQNTAYSYISDENINFDDYSFMHSAINDGVKNSKCSDLLEDTILSALSDTTDHRISIKRIRLGLITGSHQPYVHVPHVDFEHEHMTALLYLNTCDGDTIFYNEFLDPTCNLRSHEYYTKILNKTVTIKERFTPTKNAMVWFNGLQFHSSSRPIFSPRRVVINVNYYIIKD